MPKTYQSSIQTRLRILEHAIELFNERGAKDVSTNHIAEASALSPGNLYYHFHNKEEIIRSILEQMIVDWDDIYQSLDLDRFDLRALRQLVRASFELNWKYRFFYRELIALLRKDEQLRARYDANQQQRFAQQTALVARLAQLKRIRLPKDADELNHTLRIAWIVQDGWILHQEMLGHVVDEHTIEEGVDLLMHLYKPFFMTSGKGKSK